MDQVQVTTEIELKTEYSLRPRDLSVNVFSLSLRDHLVSPVKALPPISAQQTQSHKSLVY